MKKLLFRLAAPVSAAVGMGVSLMAHAQNFNLPSTNINNINSVVGQGGLLCRVAGLIFLVLMVLTVIFIILAAFKYLTAGGDPEKVKTANYQLVYAAIALVIALVARGLPNIIATFIGTSVTAC